MFLICNGNQQSGEVVKTSSGAGEWNSEACSAGGKNVHLRAVRSQSLTRLMICLGRGSNVYLHCAAHLFVVYEPCEKTKSSIGSTNNLVVYLESMSHTSYMSCC